MQQAVLILYPKATVEYRFKNRGSHKFDNRFASIFREELEKMQYLQVSYAELDYLSKLNFIQPWYVDFLRSYRFNPEEVIESLKKSN